MLLLRTLSIREKDLGPKHMLVATTLDTLAGLYCQVGRLSECEKLYLRSLDIRRTGEGASSLEVAATLTHLANLYTLQHRRNLALPLYAQARSILPQPQDTKCKLCESMLENSFNRTQEKMEVHGAFLLSTGKTHCPAAAVSIRPCLSKSQPSH
jgi:hypothetical protein